ncbi:hypothetical protein [Chitinophaga ginsengisoli]|uniref:Uncharacterized protein n=1 Tax=Chitinophaga ginsengisoli TaxID=363837 RepID=A0A2P8FXM1_9BACT|nr:hypothetical protein [Chitinophaga ginsengisoli]PSL26464.1 hypothetical protein CLV42_111179 [Chitinophaga ginsengisoli]
MRYLCGLILLIFLSKDIRAQVNLGCKCHYSSSFDIKSYKSTLDSIVGNVRKDKKDVIQVIGSRGFAAAMLTVIVTRNNLHKAYCYNFRTKKYRIVTDKRTNTWLKCLVQDSSFIYTAKADPLGMPSHDYSYFVSFNYPSVELKEICNSVFLNNMERPFSTCLKSYITFFEEATK